MATDHPKNWFELVDPDQMPFFFYAREFVSPAENASLAKFLEATPFRSVSELDPRAEFAFVRPIYDGEEITSRAEAAAGDPVWHRDSFVQGVEMPRLLQELAGRVTDAVADLPLADHLGDHPLPSFTSVYVDWYEPGGFFVPHTDREGYGPVVVGVSIGAGRVTMRWQNGETSRDIAVEPRSLYAFCGPIRYEPWQHGVVEITARRFGVTYRSHGSD